MNQTYVASQTKLLCTRDADWTGRWALAPLLADFQELAGVSCASFGYDPAYMDGRRAAWVLTRLSLRFTRVPVRGETVTLATWPDACRRLLCPRAYAVLDEAGALVCEGSALWMVIDTERRAAVDPASLGIVLPDAPPPDPARSAGDLLGRGPVPLPKRLPRTEALPQCAPRRPVYSDLDVNGHVNNTRYAAWVCDLFPPESYARRAVTELQINYHREIRPGDDVLLRWGETPPAGSAPDAAFAVEGTCADGGPLCFTAAGRFSPSPAPAHSLLL